MATATKARKPKPELSIEPEVFLAQHRRITDLEQKVEEWKASGKSAVQSAKAAGINYDAYKLLRKLRRMDPDKAERLIKDALAYARILGTGLFEQGDLFGGDSLDDLIASLKPADIAAHQEWEAEKEGYEAGKIGEPIDNCKYPVGTPFYVAYMKGYRDGEASPAAKAAAAQDEKIIKPRRGDDNPEDDIE